MKHVTTDPFLQLYPVSLVMFVSIEFDFSICLRVCILLNKFLLYKLKLHLEVIAENVLTTKHNKALFNKGKNIEEWTDASRLFRHVCPTHRCHRRGIC